MTEADEAYPFGLREASKIGDGDADQAEDGVDVVVLQGIDDKMKPIGQFS